MELMQVVGRRLRARRRERKLSQADLAARAKVSRRFLIQLEAGHGNATVLRIDDVCRALELPLSDLFLGIRPSNVALVGLRGAGKSTVGRALSARLGLEFVELDELVERDARMSLSEIFEFRGPEFYRDAEARALQEVCAAAAPKVIAVGGSLVTAPPSWRRLRDLARTVWLRASPRSHFERVTSQGDLRPMLGRKDALSEIESILAKRQSEYAMADVSLDTDAHSVEELVELILESIRRGELAAS